MHQFSMLRMIPAQTGRWRHAGAWDDKGGLVSDLLDSGAEAE